MNGICINQIKGTAMGRKFAVVGSNLVVSHTRKLDVCITSTI